MRHQPLAQISWHNAQHTLQVAGELALQLQLLAQLIGTVRCASLYLVSTPASLRLLPFNKRLSPAREVWRKAPPSMGWYSNQACPFTCTFASALRIPSTMRCCSSVAAPLLVASQAAAAGQGQHSCVGGRVPGSCARVVCQGRAPWSCQLWGPGNRLHSPTFWPPILPAAHPASTAAR
jgi:hypothetical protein